MESVSDIIKKRKGWTVILELLTPYIDANNANMVKPAQELWFNFSLQRERQIYVTLWEQKLRGIAIKNHPYYATTHRRFVSFSWASPYDVRHPCPAPCRTIVADKDYKRLIYHIYEEISREIDDFQPHVFVFFTAFDSFA